MSKVAAFYAAVPPLLFGYIIGFFVGYWKKGEGRKKMSVTNNIKCDMCSRQCKPKEAEVPEYSDWVTITLKTEGVTETRHLCAICWMEATIYYTKASQENPHYQHGTTLFWDKVERQ